MSKMSIQGLAICVIVALLVCAIPFGGASGIVSADTVENEITATVIGESSIKVDPDRANVSVSIQNVDMDVNESKEATLNLYASALECLQVWGIERPDVNVSYFRTYPSYDYQECRTLTGYYAVLNFSFMVKNLDNLNEILDQLFNVGITTIDHINFEVSDISGIYNDLLAQALDNAHDKACTLLNKAEVELLKFREENVYNCTSVYKSTFDATNIDLTSQITLSAKVTATFK